MSRCSVGDELGKRILSGRHSIGETLGERGAPHIPRMEGRSRGWCSEDRRRRGQQVLWASGERGVIV